MRGRMQEVQLTIELILGRLPRHSGPRREGGGASKQGRAVELVELRLCDEAGGELTWDGKAIGEPEARGTEFLRDKVAKWWIPEAFGFVEQIPRTAVGKHDKPQLRERYGGRSQSAV